MDDGRPWRDPQRKPSAGQDDARASALGEPARQRKDGSAALSESQRGRPSEATGAGRRDPAFIRPLRGVSSPTLNHAPVTAIDARVDDGATFEQELEAGANALGALGCLYFLGGVTTRDFVLAMLIGIISGTYSSIFNASALLVLWREIKLKKYKAA